MNNKASTELRKTRHSYSAENALIGLETRSSSSAASTIHQHHSEPSPCPTCFWTCKMIPALKV
jgi:hypothetical protein